MSELRYSMTIRLIDQITAPARKAAKGLNRLTATGQKLRSLGGRVLDTSGLDQVTGAAGKVGDRFRAAAGEAGKLGVKIAALGGAGAWLFKRELLDTAAAFETFRTVLETTEGSAAKAQKSMNWISDFAATTPFDLQQVTESFVQLRAYGLDPTTGLLRTLGDTAAAMNKPIGQAVEAIADAVTGENERLKEFGIKASQSGDKIVYSYTANGKQMRAIAQANNRAMIQATLEGIWNDKFGGAMGRLSKTYNGMMSNLGDQWTRFKMLVMEAGAFDFIKGKLSDLLAKIDDMAASGKLRKLADSFGTKLVHGLKMAWHAGVALGKAISVLGGIFSRVAAILGGWENLGIALASLIGTKLIVSLGALTVSVVQFGIALATTPVGWFLGAVAAIAVAGYAIYKNWSQIGAYFKRLWDGIRNAFKDGFINGVIAVLVAFNPLKLVADAVDGLVNWLFGIDLKAIGRKWMSGLWEGITESIPSMADLESKIASVLPDSVSRRLGIGTRAEGAAPVSASGPVVKPAQRVPALQVGRTDVGGRIELVISQDGTPRVRSLETRNRDVDIEVNAAAGPMMVGP